MGCGHLSLFFLCDKSSGSYTIYIYTYVGVCHVFLQLSVPSSSSIAPLGAHVFGVVVVRVHAGSRRFLALIPERGSFQVLSSHVYFVVTVHQRQNSGALPSGGGRYYIHKATYTLGAFQAAEYINC
jgi:hypothetical protein